MSLEKFIRLVEEKKYIVISKIIWDIKSVYFGDNFNQNIDGLIFPDEIESICFSRNFNQSLDNVIFPKNLKKIYFGGEYNLPVDKIKLPDSVYLIAFYSKFNQSLEKLKFPKDLHTLELGLEFNQSLDLDFPENFSTIKICNTSNDITVNNLPKNLKNLYIGNLTKPLINLPIGLKFISIWDLNKDNLKKSKIPFDTKIVVEEMEEW
jgi:hypothetical protein